MARSVAARYGLKVQERDLKKVGKENLADHLLEQAEQSVNDVDLSDGRKYLDPRWGMDSLIDWVANKFQLNLTTAELQGKEGSEVKELIFKKVLDAYREKEIEFPVQVAMASYMAEKAQAGPVAGQKYDREGLYRWARTRFHALTQNLSEDEFRTQSRSRLRDLLLDISRKAYPQTDESEIDAKLDDALAGAKTAEEGDARELAEWMNSTFQIDIPVAELKGKTHDQARQLLWNAFDQKFRPEMRRMERNLLLDHLDSTWKGHLLTMDHLRSGIGLWGYAQVDPKIKYKQEGMKEFEQMWDGLYDRVTTDVFRMQDQGAEAFQEALWAGAMAYHAQAASYTQSVTAQQSDQSTNQAADKKLEPIRNRGEKVGRNDPCPCGSGKKYKNCHMRKSQEPPAA
jgi:preprotein translocase subunit SecA